MKSKINKSKKINTNNNFSFVESYILMHKIRIAIFIGIIIIREMLFKIPYLNIIAAGNQDLLNVIIIPLLVLVALGSKGRLLVFLSLLLFFPVIVLILFKNVVFSEMIINIAYVLLSMGIIIMAVDHFKKSNEK